MVLILTPLIAFLLPLYTLYRSSHNRPVKRAYLYSVGSITAAFAGLCAEVLKIRSRIAIGDSSGLSDTIDAVLIICICLALGTILLNLLALAINYSENKDD